MTNTGKVSFSLRGDFNTDDVTACLGIKPTHALNKGQTNPYHIIPRTSIWDYASEEVEDEYLDIYLIADSVVTELAPHTAAIRTAIQRWHLHPTLIVAINLAVDENTSTPAIGFSVPVIKFLAETGATIEVDTYRSFASEQDASWG